MPSCRKNRSASGRAVLNPAAASRGWSGVKRPARLAFRTTKLLGRREAASPENGPQAPLVDRPPHLEYQHLALLERINPRRPACPSRASGWSLLTTLWGFPCCVAAGRAFFSA